MPRRTRSKATGRLLRSERRRRIAKATTRPGEIVLIDKSVRKKKGQATRNSIQIEWHVETQWSVDLDVRKAVHEWRLALARHYRDQLLAGLKADGKGALPPLRRKQGREGDTYAVDSGWMAQNWLVGPIRGGPSNARCTLKPNGRGGRAEMINRSLDRDIDLQAVDGVVEEITKQVWDQWIADAVLPLGDGVATPVSVPHGKGGRLTQF